MATMKSKTVNRNGKAINPRSRRAAWAWISLASILIFGACPPATFAKEASQPIVLEGIKPDSAMAFGHYTFAAMWFPGICQAWTNVGEVCGKERDNPQVNQRFTLHGLWPSEPQSFTQDGHNAPTWWRYGCYWYDADKKIPESADLPPILLPDGLQQHLNRVMPLTQTHLDRHEYTKHIACFGPNPAQYFTTATAMIDALNHSEFAHWMGAHRGKTVSRQALLNAFALGFKQRDASAMQLKCESHPDSHVKNILTEIWFTIPTEKLALFPKPASFAPGRRGNCAAKIQILGH